jgi:metal-sulfur cluster biosynthetic enzyme
MPTRETGAVEQAIWDALDGVLDPCSRFNGTYLSFVALGMVDEVRADDAGAAHVRLLLDDPTCLYMVEIHHEVRQVVLGVPGVTAVEISVRGDELWDSSRLTPAARTVLGRRPSGRLIPLATRAPA